MNGWNLERRQRQAALIRTWRPWEHSTGPKTSEGKRTAAMRGHKGGIRPKLRELARVLREQRDTLNRIR